MSISPVKPSGWSLHEVLTSPQMTAVDLNTTFALDKRAGQTDTLSSAITMASGSSLTSSSGSAITINTGTSANVYSNINFDIGIVSFNDNHTTGSVVFGNDCAILIKGGGEAGHLQFGLNPATSPFVFGDIIPGDPPFSSLNFHAGQINFTDGCEVNFIASSSLNLTGVNLNLLQSFLNLDNISFLTCNGVINSNGQFNLGGSTRVRFSSPRTFSRISKNIIFNPARWSSHIGGMQQYDVTDTGNVTYILDIPQSSQITNISIKVQGGGGHVALPALMPVAVFYSKNLSSAIITTINVETDSSADVAAYQNIHNIDVSPALPVTVDNATNEYYVQLLGEEGTNSVTGLISYFCIITYTSQNMDDSK